MLIFALCLLLFMNSKGQSPSVFIESKHSSASQSSKILHALLTA